METNNHNNISKDISDFMLAEYQHISTAHFETAKQIASFFRYYLLIISAPAFIILFFDKDSEKLLKLFNGEINEINVFLCMLFCIIAVIGFLICCYIINKKFNSILYARTVNGIRKYFIDHSSVEVDGYFVLPKDVGKPEYFQYSFLAILLSFAIINSGFIYLAFLIINQKTIALISLIIFIITHICTYSIWSKNKSKAK